MSYLTEEDHPIVMSLFLKSDNFIDILLKKASPESGK